METSPIHLSSGESKSFYLLHALSHCSSAKHPCSRYALHYHSISCFSASSGSSSWKGNKKQLCVSYGYVVNSPVHLSSGSSNFRDLLQPLFDLSLAKNSVPDMVLLTMHYDERGASSQKWTFDSMHLQAP